MILAIKRLKNIGWIALVFIVLISLYPLSLSVGALRSNLERTDRQILATKKEMRYLETEFATRASLQQLEQWNDLDYGYVAPAAAQYLDGERALANLGNDRNQMKKPVRVASLTLDGIAPAGIIGSPYGDGVRIDTSASPLVSGETDSSKQAKSAASVKTEKSVTAHKPEKGVQSAQSEAAKTVLPQDTAARRRARFAASMDIDLLTQAKRKGSSQ